MVPKTFLGRNPDVVPVVVKAAYFDGIFVNLIVRQQFIQLADNLLRQQDEGAA